LENKTYSSALAYRRVDLFCQHPRWNLQVQGAPLSVYVRYSAQRRLTTYLISHKQNDFNIETLQNIMKIATGASGSSYRRSMFLKEPFDIAVILSTLSFETSKFHVKRFQRYMWEQVRA
jgi:hypothetical protein